MKAGTRAWLLGLSLLSWACAPSAMAVEGQPNVVLIVVDDMGYGDLGSYGGAMVPTPHIDALAVQGVRFTNGYAASSVCGPSRVGLLSGAYPNRFGLYRNPDMGLAAIPEDHPVLTALMQQAGYHTGFVGKWNIANDVHASVNDVFDYMIWGASYWPEPDGSYTGVAGGYGSRGKESGIWGPRQPGEEYLTDRLTQHAINFIRDHTEEEPFFLYLSYNAPHSPLHAHERHRQAVAHLPSEPERLYWAMVLAIDEGIGYVTRTLEAEGLTENTLVVFISDNGPALGQFSGYDPSWPRVVLGSTAGMKGEKGSFFEGGIRVPFIMKWPGQLPEGAVESRVVTMLDIYPTIAAAAQIELPADAVIDGKDLRPYLTDASRIAVHERVFWSGSEHGPRMADGSDRGAMREGDWKMVLRGDGKEELYDLGGDPGEQNDLAAVQSERLGRMRADFNDWLAPMPPSAKAAGLEQITKVDPDSLPLDPILTDVGR